MQYESINLSLLEWKYINIYSMCGFGLSYSFLYFDNKHIFTVIIVIFNRIQQDQH